MYVVTNREVSSRKQGLDVFGSVPNDKGPNELRLVKVTKQGGDYETEVIRDKKLGRAELDALEERFGLKLDRGHDWYPSFRAACEVFAQALEQERHILIFVHGYNNDMRDVVDTAEALEALYDVIVVPFSWPANGGGVVSGTAAYLDDKRDARVSMDALNRFLGKVQTYHAVLTGPRNRALLEEALAAEGRDNRLAVREHYARRISAECKVTLNLLCHSMGNYVLKYALKPARAEAAALIFDNVALVAADANNEAHELWVERLQVRSRVCVVINENDYALDWSRLKPGDEQGVRLGHYLRNLIASNTYYIDVSHAKAVGNAHGYYTGDPVTANAALKTMFSRAFEGAHPEQDLTFAPDLNVYRVP